MMTFWLFISIIPLLALLGAYLSMRRLARNHLSPPRGLLLVVSAVLVLIPCVLYAWLGASGQYRQALQLEKEAFYYRQIVLRLQQPKQALGAIMELQRHLTQYPDSALGWYMLGQIYMQLHEGQAAKRALLRAITLAPDDATIQEAYRQVEQGGAAKPALRADSLQ